MCSHLESVKLDEFFVGHIKLRYLVRSGGPNFIPSVRGPVRLVRPEKYTQLIFCTIRVWLYRMRICFIQHKTFYREWRLYAKGLLLIQKQAQKATCMSHHV